MEMVDLKKTHRELYSGKTDWALVDVPTRSVLWLDGHGDPNNPEWAEAVGAVYSVAYGIKFARKKQQRDSFTVPPLEGLWDIRRSTTIADADWVAMLPLPDFVTHAEVVEAIAQAAAKKTNPRYADLKLVRYDEGLALQRLYIGPYRDEAPIIADLHSRVIPDMGLAETGWHHEIYLSDPGRTAPEKLKTLLRQPVTRIGGNN